MSFFQILSADDRQKNSLCFVKSFISRARHFCIFCTALLLLSGAVFAAPILKQGSEGHDVFVLQQSLKKIGYPVEPDGIFGETTFNAVVSFQQSENLTPTGIVDRTTWHALQSRAADDSEQNAAESPIAAAPEIMLPESSAEDSAQPAVPSDPSTDSPAETAPQPAESETAPEISTPAEKQETKSALSPHPRPSALPAAPRPSTQGIQSSGPAVKPAPDKQQNPPAVSQPPQQPPAEPAPAKKPETEKKPVEQKEDAKPPQKTETAPEKAPFLPKSKVDSIINTAKKYTGTKYRFGGTTPKGFDCSGFVQYVFKQNGFSIPRTADEQYNLGKKIKKRAELEPGDLVFFSTYEKGASHCGIYLGKNKFIHVSSSKGVRIDSLDDSYWKPRWFGGKHIVKS